MNIRFACSILLMSVLALPVAGQTEQPNISWWDSDYWAEWEAERARWRAEWRAYERRHPGRVPEELSRIVRDRTPTPHRLDGGSTAAAELDYGVAPGTWTWELRRAARARWRGNDRYRRYIRDLNADRRRLSTAQVPSRYRDLLRQMQRLRSDDARRRARRESDDRDRRRRRSRGGGS